MVSLHCKGFTLKQCIKMGYIGVTVTDVIFQISTPPVYLFIYCVSARVWFTHANTYFIMQSSVCIATFIAHITHRSACSSQYALLHK